MITGILRINTMHAIYIKQVQLVDALTSIHLLIGLLWFSICFDVAERIMLARICSLAVQGISKNIINALM